MGIVLHKNKFKIANLDKTNQSTYRLYFVVKKYKVNILNAIHDIMHDDRYEFDYTNYTKPLTIHDKDKLFKVTIYNRQLIQYNK